MSEKEELAEALQKGLNSIVDCYVDSGLVAKDEAMSTLRDIAHYIEGAASEAGQQLVDLDGVEAFVLVNCELGFEQDLMQEFRKLPSVSDIKCVFGVYDLVMKIRAASESEVKEIVSKIRLINNIKSTLTMMIIGS